MIKYWNECSVMGVASNCHLTPAHPHHLQLRAWNRVTPIQGRWEVTQCRWRERKGELRLRVGGECGMAGEEDRARGSLALVGI